MTPAEEITAAAALMRERAEKAAAAAPGTWEYRDEWVWAGNCDLADIYGPDIDGVGQHIAGMHPVFALAVAGWLDREALAVAGWLDREAGSAAGMDAYEGSDAYPPMLAGYALPLAVARAYLQTARRRGRDMTDIGGGASGAGVTAPGLSEYMTPAEFAGLGSDAHHAVWRAHWEGLVDAVPASGAVHGTRLFRRSQVTELLRAQGQAEAGRAALREGTR